MQSCLWRGINQDQIPIKWDGGEEEGEDNGDKLPLNRPVNMQSISLQLEVFCIFSYYVGQIHCKQYTTKCAEQKHQVFRCGICTTQNKKLAHTRCVGVELLYKTACTHQVCRHGVTTQNSLHTPGV